MKVITALALLVLSGCTMEADVDLASSAKMYDCKDTRDGEQFSFRPENVSGVVVGYMGADTCATIVDEAGKTRRFCHTQEAYIKCVPRK